MTGLTSLTPTQPSLQYPQRPLIYLPLESSLVEHHGLPLVLTAVQELYSFPWNRKGNTHPASLTGPPMV